MAIIYVSRNIAFFKNFIKQDFLFFNPPFFFEVLEDQFNLILNTSRNV